MPYESTYHPQQRVIAVVFEGAVSPAEELDAFIETVTDERLFENARYLIDKRRSVMKVGPEDVAPQLAQVRHHQERLGPDARIAHVVARDYDFGMLRMMEMKSEEVRAHDFGVFRSLEEACEWLGLELDVAEAILGE